MNIVTIALLVALLSASALPFYWLATSPAQPAAAPSIQLQPRSLNGQVWMEVMGNSGSTFDTAMPNETIPVLKEAHATTALILIGAGYLTSSNLPTWREIWSAYQKAGLLVAMEWNMEGGWARLSDMNPEVYNFAQSHPSENWAFLVDTFVNSSSLPQGSQLLANGTSVIPLEKGIQAYVYQFYPASKYSWMYNETQVAKSTCVGPVLGGCLHREVGTPVPYGKYTIFYNSTGLYASIPATQSLHNYYNLYWISFQYYHGKLQWPSLFFANSFSVWMDSWKHWLENVTGYVNYEYQDNSGFPGTDFNPAIIAYLENTYHFNFSMLGWSSSPGKGNITKSQLLISYEYYSLIDHFAQAKEQLAHEYGVGVVLDVSDMKNGVPWQWGYADGYAPWFDPGSTWEIVSLFQGWAGPGFITNTSIAIAASDWIGSPSGLTAELVKDYMGNLTLYGELARPEGTFFMWDLQFPTTEISASALSALSYWNLRFEQSDGYGRYISNSGMQRYAYTNFLVAYNGTFMQPPYNYVMQYPVEFTQEDVGNAWLDILGSGGQPVLNLSAFQEPTFLTKYYPDLGTSGLTDVPALDGYIRSDLGLHNFYVQNEWNTYVFQNGSLYYVLLDNNYNASRSIPFVYHDLAGYVALNLSSGTEISNGSMAYLPSYGSEQLLILEPSSWTGTALLYTNSTSYQVENQNGEPNITLVNLYPAAFTATIESSTPIASFEVYLPGSSISIPASSDTTFLRTTMAGPDYIYTLMLPYQTTWAQIVPLASSQSTQSSTASSSTEQSSSTQSSTTSTSTTQSSTTSTSTTQSSTTSTSTTQSSTTSTSTTQSSTTSTSTTQSSTTSTSTTQSSTTSSSSISGAPTTQTPTSQLASTPSPTNSNQETGYSSGSSYPASSSGNPIQPSQGASGQLVTQNAQSTRNYLPLLTVTTVLVATTVLVMRIRFRAASVHR